MLTDEQARSMHDVLTRRSIKDFYKEGQVYYGTSPATKDDTYVYIQGSPDSKVLAVGHCDWVMFSKPKMNQERTRVACPQLDDRLGVWLILKFLKAALPKDMPYDILLTDNEERGQSTAKIFTPPEGKQYNWMFEFDRMGTDTVMYSYHTPELKALLEKFKFEVGTGSYTDICCLTMLDCAGFNFGVGYHGQHTQNCYADLKETASQVSKFLKFYKENYNTHLRGNQKLAQDRFDARYNPKPINYYSNRHIGYVDPPLTKDSILYINQFAYRGSKPELCMNRPYAPESIIGVATMRGEVIALPRDRHTGEIVKEITIGHGIADKYLGVKIKLDSKYFARTKLKLIGKKRLSQTHDQSIVALAKAYKEEILDRKLVIGQDKTIKDAAWIDDIMVQDWEDEAERRLITDDIPFDDDDRLPTDAELDMLYRTGELNLENFPGGKEAQKQVLQNPEI